MNVLFAPNFGDPISGTPLAGPKRSALDVLANMFVLLVSADAVEANSTTTRIYATAHAVRKGDLIEFTSGALTGIQLGVKSVQTDYFDLIGPTSVAPSVADTFDILRYTIPRLDPSGAIPVVPTAPGAGTTVTESRFHDTAVDNINDNAGAYVEVETAAALIADTTKIHITNTLGEPLSFKKAANAGAAAASTDGFNTNRGEGPLTLDYIMSIGDRLWVRSLTSTPVTSGEIVINFMG